MKILIVIPAFNEEKSILPVLEDLKKNLQGYDYIVVNDGSSDRTAEICKENEVPLIDLPVNLGLSGAFSTGMKYAKKHGYDGVIQFDADGQHLSEFIPKMVSEMSKGSNIVIGSRFVENKKPMSLRMLGSFLISFVIKLTTGKKIQDPTSGMRLFDKKIIEEFATSLNVTPEPDTVSYLIKRGVKVSEIQVEMEDRIAGESYLNFTRSIKYMIRMAVSIIILQPFRNKEQL
ncbi:glycosyltransferase family 2 protein [Carnobacterium mobile]|uniref:glycosyltransferase family 2 protein n=1 Tax=Carnobacterium mobile TaxID=2750 RepID=UPI0018666D76|nr:glycosyltransferase family 2 protein [Carnobacterium mobile]